jgi:uncharacterized protein (DUF1015 family)
MPTVAPFRGLLYETSMAGPLESLTTPPYDAITPDDRDRYYRASEHNVVRLILGREEPSDEEGSNRNTRAAASFRAWREAGILTLSPSPAVYPYRMRFEHSGVERTVRGLIAEVALEPWGGAILPHEQVLPGPVEDRIGVLRAVRANLSPVYVTSRGPSPGLADLLDLAMSGDPDREMTDETGTVHSMWALADSADTVADLFRGEEFLIADGHHRYTVALDYREEMRARNGPGPWDRLMMLVVDAALEDPLVLPFHRVLTGTVSPPLPKGSRRVRDLSEALAALDDETVKVAVACVEDGQITHRIATLDGDPPAVCALHRQLLESVATADLRYVPDAFEAESLVRSGFAAVAYFLPPTTVPRIRSIVQNGGRLPEKSTYFWPKPRTGMVIRPLEP